MKYEKVGSIPKDGIKVIVVIPYLAGERELAEKVAIVHNIKAGTNCVVYFIEDSNKIGWVQMQNWAFKNLDFDYYVYSCVDYFPGKDYLKVALNTMRSSGKKLVGFNDGKWHGLIATSGLIDKSLTQDFYGGNLFYEGYKQNYADPELTEFAMFKDEYVYQPHAVLMEVDYEKDGNPHVNMVDKGLYGSRVVPWKKRWC